MEHGEETRRLEDVPDHRVPGASRLTCNPGIRESYEKRVLASKVRRVSEVAPYWMTVLKLSLVLVGLSLSQLSQS